MDIPSAPKAAGKAAGQLAICSKASAPATVLASRKLVLRRQQTVDRHDSGGAAGGRTLHSETLGRNDPFDDVKVAIGEANAVLRTWFSAR